MADVADTKRKAIDSNTDDEVLHVSKQTKIGVDNDSNQATASLSLRASLVFEQMARLTYGHLQIGQQASEVAPLYAKYKGCTDTRRNRELWLEYNKEYNRQIKDPLDRAHKGSKIYMQPRPPSKRMLTRTFKAQNSSPELSDRPNIVPSVRNEPKPTSTGDQGESVGYPPKAGRIEDVGKQREIGKRHQVTTSTVNLASVDEGATEMAGTGNESSEDSDDSTVATELGPADDDDVVDRDELWSVFLGA